MNIKTRVLTLALTAAVAFAGVAAASGIASAQEPTATPGQTKHEKRVQRRDDFLSRVAARVGVTLDELKAAFKSAATEAVDDALASGEITQAQADKLKANIENGNGLGLRELIGKRARRATIAQRVRAGIVKSTATALNMSPAGLVAELKSGKSIADVAGANLDAVKAQITSDAKTKLDAAVAANKITQAQEDAALQKLADNLDTIVNKTRGQTSP